MFTVVDVGLFLGFTFFGKTKTVYRPFAKESVLKALPESTGGVMPAVCVRP